MILAVDTETTGTDRWHGCRPFLVTACDGRNNYYFKGVVNPYDRLDVYWDPETLVEIQNLLDHAQVLVFHNAKFDLHMLEAIGIDLSCLWEKVEDTMLASHALCSGESHALKYLAFKYMDYYNEDEQLLEVSVKQARQNHKEYDLAKQGHPSFPGMSGPRINWWKMDYWLCPEECITYGLSDVERTWGLWQIFYEALDHHELLSVYGTRIKLIQIAFDMETVGYNMYADEVRDEITYLKDRREALTTQIRRLCSIVGDFDLNKDQHLSTFLFKFLDITPTRFTEAKGNASVSKDAVNEMIEDNPTVLPLQLYKEFSVAGTQIGYLASYLKWVCPDDKVRGSVFITGTRNTRQAYRDPNLQNIDKRLQHTFGPPPGKLWIDFDLVSIEPRIWAYLTGNKELIKVLEYGGSPHLLFSSIVYPDEYNSPLPEPFKVHYETTLYKYVKAGGLALMYGAGKNKADKTFQKAGAYELITKRMPEIPEFNARCTYEIESNVADHYAPWVTCLGGYKLDVKLDDIYVGPNTKIQGTAGWIIGEAMINVKNNPDYIASKSQMVVQVHDSIKVEISLEAYSTTLALSLQKSIEDAGKKLLPTCRAEYKLTYNPYDAPF